jgi:copper chaperone CopZ
MPQKLNFKVVGSNTMHCAGCETSDRFTLVRLPGVREVNSDCKTQIIEIAMDESGIDQDKVKVELDWLGYEVEALS